METCASATAGWFGGIGNHQGAQRAQQVKQAQTMIGPAERCLANADPNMVAPEGMAYRLHESHCRLLARLEESTQLLVGIAALGHKRREITFVLRGVRRCFKAGAKFASHVRPHFFGIDAMGAGR